MNWKKFLPTFGRSAKNAALETAIAGVANGTINTRNLDDEALAILVFTLADQIHRKNPNAPGRYGWARLTDVEAFTHSLLRKDPPSQQAGTQ